MFFLKKKEKKKNPKERHPRWSVVDNLLNWDIHEFIPFGLVQFVLETSKNRGVSQTLGRQSLYMTGAAAACFDDYGDGHYSRTHRQHHIQNVELNLRYTLKKSLICVRLSGHSMRAADVASTTRRMSLGRWFFVACFSSVKNHNVSGPNLFPSVTTHAKKIPMSP